MSYSKSPVQTSAEAADALRHALVRVCEESFFAYVEPCEPARFAELVGQINPDTGSSSPGWLNASVAFVGSFSGAIEILVPERLARWLVASIIGTSQDAELRHLVALQQMMLSEHQIFDGIGEFANMICGAWLTDLNGCEAFELRPPAVTRMAPDWNPVPGSQASGGNAYQLCVNDLPIVARLWLAVK
jgi:chemotaxis phosphatase CheX-like protein